MTTKPERSVVEIGGAYYVVVGRVPHTYVARQSPPYRLVGVQSTQNDPSVNRYRHQSFAQGIGWARMNRETGRGVEGMLDSTCWTALGPRTLAKLQETQSHAATADHFKRAQNFKSDLWGMFEEEYVASGSHDVVARKFGATSDDWTGGGQITPAENTDTSARGWDMISHKNSLFALCNNPASTADEVTYIMRSSTDGVTWADAGLTGWPDSTTTNRYLPTSVTRRNNFDDDMGRLLSFGNVLLAAIYLHPSATDGNGTIRVYSSTDSGANWVLDVTIPSGDGPKAFVDWVTLGGVRSPVLVTAEGVWSIDYTNDTFALIYELDGDPNTGRWATVGNDGSLYVGLGSGLILRLTIREADNLDVMVIGPAGDGLVTARQGRANYILKTPSKWLLVAYGGHAASKNASIFMIDTSVILTDPETGEKFMPWHHMYQNVTANLDIVALAYSTEDDSTPRLHFAVEGAAASVNSHIEEPFVNPKQSTTVKYQPSAISFIRFPVDDLGDPHTNADILQGLVSADDLSVNITDEFIEEEYGLDGAADTTVELGNYLSGTLALSFGSGAGVAGKTIGRRLNFFRGATNTNTPKLNESELRAHKVYIDKRVWGPFVIDIDATEQGETKPDKVADTDLHETIITALETVAASTTLVTFQAGGMAQTRVKVSPAQPPVFDLHVVDSDKVRRGYRSGYVTMVLEQGIV